MSWYSDTSAQLHAHPDPILYAIPAFIVLLIAEALWARQAVKARGKQVDAKHGIIRGFSLKDSAASIAMGLGSLVVTAATKVPEYFLYLFANAHSLFKIPVTWWSWLLLVILDDLCYWVYHASSHKVRLFWASHVNHHSSEHYNLSTALRQSWTKQFVTPWFWLPLAILGFPAWMIVTQQALSLIYQYWVHTEAIRTLGPLEWVLNTPSHHRVHHASNGRYLDKNHAGTFIVWDRLFGTFEREDEPVVYGLTKNIHGYNLWTIAFHEYADILRDLRAARSLREAFLYVFGPPGWTPSVPVAQRDAASMVERGSVGAAAVHDAR